MSCVKPTYSVDLRPPFGKFFLCCCAGWAGLLPASAQHSTQLEQTAAQPASATLPESIAQALQQIGIPSKAVAIVVQQTSESAQPVNTLLAHNATNPMNPASVMKLLTTYAALDLLGPATTWKTGFYANQPIRDGVLEGDLYIKTTGDPKFLIEHLWLSLRRLQQRGLHEIRGNVILDRSLFEENQMDPGQFDQEPYKPQNTPPDAAMFNFRSIRFEFMPQANAVKVVADPALVRINAQIKLTKSPCGEWREQLSYVVHQEKNQITFSGQYPESCGNKVWNLSIQDAPQFLTGAIRQLWHEAGGRGIRNTTAIGGIVPVDANLLWEHESPPLSELVRDTNKFSNNLMARQLFLALAAYNIPNNLAQTAQPERPTGRTTERATQVVLQWLQQKNLNIPELVLENGSGLSRLERMSAKSIAALLQSAWQNAVMPEFLASLPLVGVDGTMRKRLVGQPIMAQAHIKTGSLNDVRAIAGYLRAQSGKRYVVVMLINHPRAPQAQAAMDELLRWAYTQ